MQPEADMVPKECRFNQSEIASCARVAWRFLCSPAVARDGELTQRSFFFITQIQFAHPNSHYVTTKLYETSACGCNNNMIFQNELFSRFLPSTYVAWPRRSLGVAVRKSLDGDFKVVQWYSMWLVWIAGYFLNISYHFSATFLACLCSLTTDFPGSWKQSRKTFQSHFSPITKHFVSKNTLHNLKQHNLRIIMEYT